MKNEQLGLNYISFLSTPPATTRTQLSNSLSGGGTTRRSMPHSPQSTFNGIYEGDFTMFDDTIKDIATKPPYSNYRQSIMDDHYLGDALDLGLEQNEEHFHDDVDEEIRGKTIEFIEPEKKVFSYWEQYKGIVFTAEQSAKIEAAVNRIKQNSFYRKISFAIRCIAIITIWILRLLFCSVVLRVFELSCATLRSRNILRSGTRRILWYMTLAKCGDLQLYGLIMLLSPLLFLVAFLGFIFSAYCDIKNGIFAFINYVRYRLDVEPPKFD